MYSKDTRNPMYGRHHTLEARAKMAIRKRGVPKSAEHRAKISAAMKGKPKSEATRLRMKGRVPWNKGLKGVSRKADWQQPAS